MMRISKFGSAAIIATVLMTSAFSAQAQDQAAPPPVPTADQTGLDQFVTPPEQNADQTKQMLNDAAFNNALDSAMPLRPDQIQQLIGRMSSLQQAAAPALADPVRPTPVVKVDTISLDPSGMPPEVKLAAGYVSSIMVLDATGQPWPIKDIAFSGKFDIKIANDDKHVIRIIPLSRFYDGNMSIQLQGLATPVTFRLTAGNTEVYYRYDVRVPALGPNARTPRIANANSLVAGDPVIMSVLDGYPPTGSKRLAVKGLDTRTAAWEIDGQIYLRTPHSLLSPAWSSSAASGDGTTVYLIPDTPVLLLSDQGLMVRARLERPQALTSGEQ